MIDSLRWVLILFCFCMGQIVFAVQTGAEQKALSLEGKVLSLHDAIAIALRYNPSVIIARMQRVLDKFDLRVAKNTFELQYALSGGVTHTVSNGLDGRSITRSYGLSPGVSLTLPYGTKLGVTMENGFSADSGEASYYTPSSKLSITQPLLRGAGSKVVQAGLRDAEISYGKNSRLTLQANVIDQVNAVVASYYNLVQAKNELVIQKNAYQQQQKRYKRTQAYINAGKTAPREIINEERSLRQHALSVTQAKNSILEAKRKFVQAIGLYTLNNVDVVTKISTDKLKIPELKKAQAIALQHNIEYQKELNAFAITERGLFTARNKAKWDLSLSATYTFGGTQHGLGGVFEGRDKSREVDLTLDVPIRNLDLKRDILSASNSLKQARINLAVKKQDLLLQVHNMIQTLHNFQEQMTQSADLVKTSKDALFIEEKKQAVGRSTILDVTIRQNELIAAQINQTKSQISFITTMNDLWKLLGITLDEWKVSIKD